MEQVEIKWMFSKYNEEDENGTSTKQEGKLQVRGGAAFPFINTEKVEKPGKTRNLFSRGIIFTATYVSFQTEKVESINQQGT